MECGRGGRRVPRRICWWMWHLISCSQVAIVGVDGEGGAHIDSDGDREYRKIGLGKIFLAWIGGNGNTILNWLVVLLLFFPLCHISINWNPVPLLYQVSCTRSIFILFTVKMKYRDKQTHIILSLSNPNPLYPHLF